MSKMADADAFIQWKGTDVCLDFHCYKCDHFGHFDGDFAYFLRCGRCGQVYSMPSTVALKAVSEEFAEKTNGCIQDVADDKTSASDMNWAPTLSEGQHTYVGDKSA